MLYDEVHSLHLRGTTERIGFNKMRRITNYVQREAKRRARGGKYSDTGRLANSIIAIGPYIVGSRTLSTVETHLSYAAAVERGARVHDIFPKAAPHIFRFGSRRRPQLKFVWHGRLVFTPHVPMGVSTIGRSHPGQKGKRYMQKALESAARRYRMEFIPGPGNVSML